MKIDLNSKLDFTEIDLTAPDKVIEEVLSQLPEETNGYVLGKILEYNGHVFSYTQRGLAGLSATLGTAERRIDIQDDLGAKGEEKKKYECFLYTPVYDHYKYRLFFVQYGVANYPVKLILEESIAQSISLYGSSYIITCNNRNELETMLGKIFSSKRTVSVIQELIRIHQAKKDEPVNTTDEEETTEETSTEE